MTLQDLALELDGLALVLDKVVKESRKPEIRDVLADLKSACDSVGLSWSKSWIGYHSRTYYEAFGVPPAGTSFSVEWGLMNVSSSTARGRWVEYSREDVREQINYRAGIPDRSPMLNHEASANQVFRDSQATFVSVLVAAQHLHDDSLLSAALDQGRSIEVKTVVEILREWTPTALHSRDRRAVDEGIEAPVHLQTLAILTVIEMADKACNELSQLCRNTAQHLRRFSMVETDVGPEPGRIFIGHGHSLQWRVLKDYLQDVHGLPWDEFNRVPAAGMSTKERLEQMLRTSTMAFLIFTAEDERESNVFHARENVIHEAGLFQGKLSFERAIILLEESCTGFSNIDGLTVIKFPPDNISASFEEVRLVLQRERLIS